MPVACCICGRYRTSVQGTRAGIQCHPIARTFQGRNRTHNVAETLTAKLDQLDAAGQQIAPTFALTAKICFQEKVPCTRNSRANTFRGNKNALANGSAATSVSMLLV